MKRLSELTDEEKRSIQLVGVKTKMLINNGDKQPDPNALEFIKYRILGKPYIKWLAIVSEATGGQGEMLFKAALFHGYNIRIDDPLADPMLYITQDSAQDRELREAGIVNPTFYQLILSTHVVALTEEDATARMQAWMEAQKA